MREKPEAKIKWLLYCSACKHYSVVERLSTDTFKFSCCNSETVYSLASGFLQWIAKTPEVGDPPDILRDWAGWRVGEKYTGAA